MDDAFEVPLDKTFDVVFSVGLIEHFDDAAMARLVGLHRRWAAADGLVLIAVPTPTTSLPHRPDRRGSGRDSEVPG